MTLISSVQTLLIQTFNFPSTPSTPSRSTPSHQHLRAGFRQNRSSFCAIPTALLPISPPRMSVRNLASARLQITALFGSFARWPQWSSWLNPLLRINNISQIVVCMDLPCCQHLDQVLFCSSCLFTSSQPREDPILLQ